MRGAVAPNLRRRLFDLFGRRPQPAAGLRHIQTDQRNVAALADRPRHDGRSGHGAARCRHHVRCGGRRFGCSGFPLGLGRLICTGLLAGGRCGLSPGRRLRLARFVIRQRPLPCIAGGQQAGGGQQARGRDGPGNGALHLLSRSDSPVTQHLSACSLAVRHGQAASVTLRARHMPNASFSSFPLSNRAVVAASPSRAHSNVAAEIQFAACADESERQGAPAFYDVVDVLQVPRVSPVAEPQNSHRAFDCSGIAPQGHAFTTHKCASISHHCTCRCIPRHSAGKIGSRRLNDDGEGKVQPGDPARV